ncbi:alpha/beta fold hydrolase [Sinorhizobium meliloti]|uniref:alpha/beta fold hydrolase n=1 Tax=Rhizobium meliloti TaxID=382 RepID=UPI00299F3E79|nr:alpha/beta fold hydrolase [Sinorhizobium meliloti]MDW9527046.1 alpha/beta fold hydrolase [Sinorhizobium meliloti]MDW9657928.1 alpha/beta fold hydrolase [Sinorhizobium meliloti]MDW9880781.1 alpha/beta fold hydrolase [Sinorhizobium meliloti]MDW9917881.1 alpha/beta fold hydrolase [Sinorhizobium meliloti]
MQTVTSHTFGEGGATLPRKTTARGTAYFEAGDGETLILIHGVGMRLEAWAPQIEAFAKTHRVFALDMPGHGASEKIPAGSTVRDYVAWFGCFLEDLSIARASIAGHSMGALISGGAVATFSDRITRVAYLNGVYRRDAAAKAAVLARAEAIRKNGVDAEGPLERWFGEDPESQRARELTRTWLEMVDPEGYAIAYAAFAGGDEIYADCWPSVECPALFLTGSGDPNSTPEMAKQMASVTPKGWARIVDGHRHMVNLTAPEIVNTLMSEWLTSREKPR